MDPFGCFLLKILYQTYDLLSIPAEWVHTITHKFGHEEYKYPQERTPKVLVYPSLWTFP